MRFYMGRRLESAVEKKEGQGSLLIAVTTAGGIVPLLDASVSVSRSEMLLYHRMTGPDGMVPRLTVTVSPESAQRSAYGRRVNPLWLEVRVFLIGFISVSRRICVYPDKTTYLQVDMVPDAGADALGVSKLG